MKLRPATGTMPAERVEEFLLLLIESGRVVGREFNRDGSDAVLLQDQDGDVHRVTIETLTTTKP